MSTPLSSRHISLLPPASPTVLANGTQEWRVNGTLHRLDGPAAIYANGSKEWYLDGKLHRLDGPAFVRADGTQAWYIHDKLHRLDGPAIVYADGSEKWLVDGHNITHCTAHAKMAYIHTYMHKNDRTSLPGGSEMFDTV